MCETSKTTHHYIDTRQIEIEFISRSKLYECFVYSLANVFFVAYVFSFYLIYLYIFYTGSLWWFLFS